MSHWSLFLLTLVVGVTESALLNSAIQARSAAAAALQQSVGAHKFHV
jgi:hypothetical protein